MLVFENEESFKAMSQKLEKMSFEDRKRWEESIGFKSYDRLQNEIIVSQTALIAKYESLPLEVEQKLFDSGNHENYTELTKESIKKGIVKIVINEKNEGHLEFKMISNSNLVNTEGFVAVGNTIRQYTENRFKLIKSLDFSKMKNLVTMDDEINNADFYVNKYVTAKNKSTSYYSTAYGAESYTVDRKKVVLEVYQRTYDPYSDNVRSQIEYYLRVKNEKKRRIGPNWDSEFAIITLWGNCTIPFEEPKYVSANHNLATENFPILDREYITAYGPPTISSSTWNVFRGDEGGGLGVTIRNDNSYVRF